MANGIKMGLWSIKVANGSDLAHPDNVISWSDEMRKMLGFTGIDDFPNTLEAWLNVLVEEHRERTKAAVIAAFDDPDCFDLYDVEYQIKNKDGSLHWYRARGDVERDASGKPIRLVGAIEDIDEVRQANGDREFHNNAIT